VIGAKAGPHYPAPMMAIKTMQKAVTLPRAKAQEVEAKNFAKLATNSVTKALVGLFLKDQFVKRVSKQYEAGTDAVKQAAVLGAGIMGGGVAYQSASKGVPILMKDIRQEALALGLSEATQLLEKQVSRGKLDTKGMANVLNQITPTLSFGDFEPVDLVVEAVVENPKIKASVLADLEANVSDDAIITSNTSTISINSLAKSLKKPERFCGMHFFNPVHRMPLVEVIRGEHSSDAAIAKTVAYAKAMGKTPIVVNDCAGFLVNRVLFPYFAGFSQLVSEGVDFQRIDKVMEGFGWPMGPAYLLDVVGLDTAAHADQVMADAFPDRMGHEGQNAIDLLFAANRLGQKNKQGFYQYELDRKGKLQKKADRSVYELIGLDPSQSPDITDEEIIARMMIPLCVETVRCLEEKIVASPAEADMALIYGIGFPPFRGGVFHYLDEMGLGAFCEMAAPFDAMGPLYQPTAAMKSMAEHGQTYGLTGRGQ
jgi:3-hydroxyacyl-CoA dehydrogenase/enoyl-CoA hydratase/3-hydroxybutyryl-CoA epimerase/enoyl-CoA isomerase